MAIDPRLRAVDKLLAAWVRGDLPAEKNGALENILRESPHWVRATVALWYCTPRDTEPARSLYRERHLALSYLLGRLLQRLATARSARSA